MCAIVHHILFLLDGTKQPEAPATPKTHGVYVTYTTHARLMSTHSEIT